MVGALHVDRAAVSPPPLVHVVRDIRQEVRIVATTRRTPPHATVLVVPELGGPEEERAILLVGMARRDERSDRGVDLAVRVQRALEEILVELHAERLKVEVLLLAELRDGEATHGIVIAAIRILRMRLDVLGGDLGD